MRHRERHVHETILQHVKAGLGDLGWFADPVPFGTVAVEVVGYQPLEAGETPSYNTVAVSMGDSTADLPFELGGGLSVCNYPFFVDVYGASEPIGVAIANDIKDALTDQIIGLRDYTTTSAGVPTDAQIEFDLVMTEKIPTATTTLDKRSWRSVKATAVLYF